MQTDRNVLLAFLAALTFIALVCSCAQLAGGDATETGNARISGKIVDSLGLPVPQTRIMLLPALYNPLADPAIRDSMNGITDEAGCYTLKAPGPGAYCIEAMHSTSTHKALVTGVTVGKKDTTLVQATVLRKPGALRVALPDTVLEASGYVYLPGTSCYARAQSGIATVGAVPAGLIPAVNYANTAAPMKNHVIQTNVAVQPDDTLVIADTTPWKYSKKLYCNTTAAGAGVGQDVYNFPLLVRLTSANFDFSQAKSDGGDLRFTKPDHAPLRQEIERWDMAAKVAEVWVRVDTVYGNNSAQYIVMRWGASAAVSMSNSPAVFDTGTGFQGVWHLSEAGNAIAKDATGNHYDGTPSDTAPAVVEGTIGPCRSFNGSSNYIRMNGTADSKLNFPENGTYAVSAWVYTDSIDNSSHVVVGKGNEQYFIKFKTSLPGDPMVWEFVEYFDKAGWAITNSLPIVPSARKWVLIVGVRRGNVQFFYLNGELVDSTLSVSPSAMSRITGEDVTIGRFLSKPIDSIEGIGPFLGKIDEVRISNAAYGADWIKLCYMNQKEPDALVKW
jgi:hypothetical protein